MTLFVELNGEVSEELDGKRLDLVLVSLFPQYSRAQHQAWIKQSVVKVDAKPISKPKHKVQTAQNISLKGQIAVCQENWQPQNIPINIVFEDEEIIIINKAAGLTVHPGAGQADNTLVNALKYYCPQLENLPRAGLVHRLDKDTSGVLVVAKTLLSYQKLVSDLAERKIQRHYIALVHGAPISGGDIAATIGRDRANRLKMAVDGSNNKPALTSYRVKQRLRYHCVLDIKLATGRTHQIRVHMSHIKLPLVGDQLYGRRIQPAKDLSSDAICSLQKFKRQALHAHTLEFNHPTTNQYCKFTAPLADDLQNLINILTKDAQIVVE